ncbi:MAG TPA: hypothetical protein PLN53_00870 [Terricaulis sp.]|nr:hypothetical protein [Terricaulis sp.]
MALRALIAALLIPALGAGTALGVLHAMAAYTGAGLDDVMQACAPAGLAPLLSAECEPVQPHYWLLLLSAATAVAGLGLMLLRLMGGRTDWSVFSFRGLLAAPIVTAQWATLVWSAYLAEAQFFDRLPAAQLILAATLLSGLALWGLIGLLRLRTDD